MSSHYWNPCRYLKTCVAVAVIGSQSRNSPRSTRWKSCCCCYCCCIDSCHHHDNLGNDRIACCSYYAELGIDLNTVVALLEEQKTVGISDGQTKSFTIDVVSIVHSCFIVIGASTIVIT